MKGYPKTLNSKADYLYCLKKFPGARTIQELQKLLDSRSDWFYVQKLDSEADGVTDETHKVVTEGTEEAPQYSQYEYRENPMAKIFRLGFTVAEVEGLIAEAQNS